MGLNESRATGTIAAVSLAVTLALLIAIVLSSDAEAQRGGGGRGGGGGGKPSAPSKSSSGSGSSVSKAGDKGLPQGVANPKSPYYNSPNYGIRHGAFSNFFLWAWIFHDFDDDDYEEEYVESNYSFGGWAILGVGAVGTFFSDPDRPKTLRSIRISRLCTVPRPSFGKLWTHGEVSELAEGARLEIA